jgi:hypothetical protein
MTPRQAPQQQAALPPHRPWAPVAGRACRQRAGRRREGPRIGDTAHRTVLRRWPGRHTPGHDEAPQHSAFRGLPCSRV